VLVLGSSISAWMVAAGLRHALPDLRVTVVGPRVGEEKRPIVGESLVEPAILFFTELGLGPELEARHELKNGLAFYHKLSPRDPSDRRYTVHAPMEKLHYRSRQLHRPAFDIQLASAAMRRGVGFVEGRVSQVTVGRGGARHRVHGEGQPCFDLEARWIVDATGRSRVLGRQVTEYERPTHGQRSAFWFRLADFDPLLPKLELSWRRPVDYDLWQSTHHFMGHGNWIWGIPLLGPAGEKLLSMGITWCPDVLPVELRTLDDFLTHVGGEHPAIAEMVRGGRVLDTQRYRNYLYRAEQVYSADGWFLVGDAARTVDPLYSTGLSMTVVQIEQITEIIRRQRGAGIDAPAIAELQALWKTVAGLRQADITDQYRTMGDPFQACMRRYWNLCGWFNGILPLWWNGYLADPAAARVLRRFFDSGTGPSRAAWRLFAAAARDLGEVDQADFDRTVDFDWLINRRFDCTPGELPHQLGRLLWKRARLRWNLLGITRYRQLPRQLRPLLRELLLAGLVRTVAFRHPALRGVRPPHRAGPIPWELRGVRTRPRT
jgi:flavin-dependent dehydrogenase